MNPLLQINDGFSDATEILQLLLDGGGIIEIPQGRYRITKTLKIHSNTFIKAHSNARIYMCGNTPKFAHDYLLTNSDINGGNENIRICGGIWDGNNSGKYNTKGNIRNLGEYSGTVLNFCNVTGLVLSDMIVANSVTYNIRMAKINNFTITDIGFLSDQKAFNQDGLHFNGWCKNGYVANISALSKGQTNDDLIALNADDSMERVENIGMFRGDIENIIFENLFAEDCHTIIRMLSFDHDIRNITIKNVFGGYRCYALNADAARYCATPLFKDADFPHGVGRMENISIDRFTCYTNSENPAIMLETLSDNISISNFRFIDTDKPHPPALKAKNITDITIRTENGSWYANDKSDRIEINDFSNLTITKS